VGVVYRHLVRQPGGSSGVVICYSLDDEYRVTPATGQPL
jgi:hypothetical protein